MEIRKGTRHCDTSLHGCLPACGSSQELFRYRDETNGFILEGIRTEFDQTALDATRPKSPKFTGPKSCDIASAGSCCFRSVGARYRAGQDRVGRSCLILVLDSMCEEAGACKVPAKSWRAIRPWSITANLWKPHEVSQSECSSENSLTACGIGNCQHVAPIVCERCESATCWMSSLS